MSLILVLSMICIEVNDSHCCYLKNKIYKLVLYFAFIVCCYLIITLPISHLIHMITCSSSPAGLGGFLGDCGAGGGLEEVAA